MNLWLRVQVWMHPDILTKFQSHVFFHKCQPYYGKLCPLISTDDLSLILNPILISVSTLIFFACSQNKASIYSQIWCAVRYHQILDLFNIIHRIVSYHLEKEQLQVYTSIYTVDSAWTDVITYRDQCQYIHRQTSSLRSTGYKHFKCFSSRVAVVFAQYIEAMC